MNAFEALAAEPFPTIRVGNGPGMHFLEFVEGGSLESNPSRTGLMHWCPQRTNEHLQVV